jgi:peptidyl-prolyl cis-trans isomerase B (cyclophilin B)
VTRFVAVSEPEAVATGSRASKNYNEPFEQVATAQGPDTIAAQSRSDRMLREMKRAFSAESAQPAMNIESLRGCSRRGSLSFWATVVALLIASGSSAIAQNPTPNSETLKKANARPASSPQTKTDPFDGASVEKMSGQCVALETEQGEIVIEMLPAKAPEAVRNFLNLAATGSLDTTTFSRIVHGFVIQGGNLSTSEKWSQQLADRMGKHLPDEPSDLKHERGVVSMARTDEPNSATTHFFILVGGGPHLDGKFSAFGRVIRGIEVADAINRAPAENEAPNVPIRITHAKVSPCTK